VAIKKITINNTDIEHLKEIKREIVSLAKITPHKNLIVLKGLTYY
jgi:aromatic ring-opening dioxygenase LigB subunit